MEIILNQFPHAEIFLAIYIGHFQVDPNDPNYDSDSTEPKGPSANGTKRTIKLNTMVKYYDVGMVHHWNSQVPEMSEEDIRKAVEPLLLEYFDNGDCDEVFSRRYKVEN